MSTSGQATYRLVPLAGNVGTQLVDGKADALRIATDIAREQRAHVTVTREWDHKHVVTIEPYAALCDAEHPAHALSEWNRLDWWTRRHAGGHPRVAALVIWYTEFAEGRRLYG